MPTQKLEPEDVLEIAKRVSGRVTYPINDYKQLSEALGGDDAEIEVKGKRYKPGQVRKLFPGDYFPIESEEDLVAKVGDLLARAYGEEPDIKWGEEQREKPRDKERPKLSDRDIPRPRGVPAIRGWKEDQ